jgi:hypothetical protein
MQAPLDGEGRRAAGGGKPVGAEPDPCREGNEGEVVEEAGVADIAGLSQEEGLCPGRPARCSGLTHGPAGDTVPCAPRVGKWSDHCCGAEAYRLRLKRRPTFSTLWAETTER